MSMLLRRYHDTPKVAEVTVEAGITPTDEEAAEAAKANEAQRAAEQAEQAQRAEAGDAEGTAVNDAVEAQTATETEGATVVPDPATVTEHPKRNASTETWRTHVGSLPEDQRPEGWETASRDELANALLGASE